MNPLHNQTRTWGQNLTEISLRNYDQQTTRQKRAIQQNVHFSGHALFPRREILINAADVTTH